MTIRTWYHRIFSDNSRSKSSRRSRKQGLATFESLETRALLTVTFARAKIDTGDGSFSDLRIGRDPISQAFADFNNDGQVDAVLAVSDAGGGLAGIKVFQPMPTGIATSFRINSAAIATSVVTGDFNSDGNIDIAVGFIDLSTVTIFTGDGQGNFPTSTDVNIATGVVAMAAADFNGDGKMDLAVAEGDILGVDNKVKVLSGNGNNTFQNAVILSNTAVAPGGLVTGDINGDNKVDLIVADLNGAAVSVFAGQGNGSFSAAASFAVGQNPKSVALGDFNLDGKVDLVSANEGSNTVSILRGNGDGTFQPYVDFVVGTAPRSVAVGDFNQDGKPDLVVANWGSNNVAVLEGRGTGNFAPPEFFATGYGPSNVAVQDLDQDGYPDLSVLNLADSTATVLYDNGPSILTKVNDPGVTGFTVTADFNGDGYRDLASASPSYFGTSVVPHYDHVDIRLGNGEATFQTPIRIAVSGHALATGDFNRDGIADLVVTDIAVAHVFLGNGDSTFANDIPYSTGLDQFAFALDAHAATGVTVSDFNGDQIPDLLFVSNRYRSGTHSYIGIALGNGDGTFSQSQIYGPPDEYERIKDVVVADFNGDGRSDVGDSVVIDTLTVDEDIVRIRLGGSTLGAEIKSPIRATSMVAGDFTGDGKTDLAVVSSDFNTLRLYPGNGDGSFGDSVFSSSGFDYFYDLATSDVNGDGRLDLVAKELLINRGGYGVATYLGNGDGTFQLPYFEPIDSYSLPLVTADFDQNGLPDVFSSNLLLNLPIVVTISSSSVAENLPFGTVVGTLSTAHPDDPGNFFSYTLISGTGSTDNGAFTLDPDGTLKTAAVVDREIKASYSIRLKSTDSIGVISEKVLTISVDNVFESPVVTGPGSTISHQSPTFTWTPDTAAASCDIWFSNLTTGQVVRANTTNTSWTPDSPIGIGQYRFWARGKASGGSVSPWSVPVTFRVVTPVSLSPMDIRQNSQRPTVSWGALKGAATYEVWLSDLTNNNSPLIRESAGSATSWKPSVDLPIGSYRVWIRGTDGKGIAAKWSTSSPVVVAAAPVVTESVQSTFSRTPTLSWSVVSGAVSYDLRLANYSTGEIKSLTGMSDTTWTPVEAIGEGNWIWRVQAANASGQRTFWSQSAQLYVGGRSQMLAPSGSNVSAQPVFQWIAVSGAASYSLIVSRSVDSVNVIRQTGLTVSSHTSPATLQAGTYRAWVRAVSTSGEVSIWSRYAEFTVAAHAAEPLIDPSLPHSVSTPLLVLLTTNRNINHAGPLNPGNASDPVPSSEKRLLNHEAVSQDSSGRTVLRTHPGIRIPEGTGVPSFEPGPSNDNSSTSCDRSQPVWPWRVLIWVQSPRWVRI
jgi:hypothetical protein